MNEMMPMWLPGGPTSFSFRGHPMRVVLREGEPWFVAADVCAALSTSNHRDALGKLDPDEKGVG